MQFLKSNINVDVVVIIRRCSIITLSMSHLIQKIFMKETSYWFIFIILKTLTGLSYVSYPQLACSTELLQIVKLHLSKKCKYKYLLMSTHHLRYISWNVRRWTVDKLKIKESHRLSNQTNMWHNLIVITWCNINKWKLYNIIIAYKRCLMYTKYKICLLKITRNIFLIIITVTPGH